MLTPDEFFCDNLYKTKNIVNVDKYELSKKDHKYVSSILEGAYQIETSDEVVGIYWEVWNFPALNALIKLEGCTDSAFGNQFEELFEVQLKPITTLQYLRVYS